MELLRPDLAQGKTSFYKMSNGDLTMYGRAQYLELQSPLRLVYTQQFCDEHEAISRHPLSPIWPETMPATVTFAAEGPSRTRVTVQWQPYGAGACQQGVTCQLGPCPNRVTTCANYERIRKSVCLDSRRCRQALHRHHQCPPKWHLDGSRDAFWKL